MNTSQAREFLRCSRGTLYAHARKGRLKYEIVKGNAEWDDRDLRRLAGLPDELALTVVYARTEPTDGLEPAGVRLSAQKQRLLGYCQAKGWDVDMVIGEERRVNRVRDVEGGSSGLGTLLELLKQKKLSRLVVETRDRLVVGGSWEFFEMMCKALGCQVVVVNRSWGTTESREESKNWIADMLLVYKAMNGEVRDRKLVEQFFGGPDLGTAKTVIRRMEAAQAKRERNLRKRSEVGKQVDRGPVDLDQLFGD